MAEPDPALLAAAEALADGLPVGVLVPPANPVVEPELHRLLPASLRLHAARLPVMPGTTLEERNRRYPDAYAATLEDFGELRLAAAVVGLTGPSYRLGPQGDAALAARLSNGAGLPVQTASGAIAEALAAIGARRLCLFSPYDAWLTEQAAAYLTAAGHEVAQVVQVSETFRAYELTTAEVAAAMAQVDHAAVDATVMSGTGMITLPGILAARQAGVGPILSSNLCCAWWLMRRTGRHAPAAPMFSAAAPELASRLG